MGELAVRPVDRSPLFSDSEDLRDFVGQHRMHRRAARGEVAERAQLASAGPPAVHPVVADLPHTGGPCVPEPGGNGVVDGVADQLFGLGGGLSPGPVRSVPAGFSPDDGQLDRLDLDRLGELTDLCPGRFELPVPFGGRATRLAGQPQPAPRRSPSGGPR